MRRTRLTAAVAGWLGLLGLSVGPALAQQFSADMVTTGSVQQARTGKIYVSNGMIRMDQVGRQMGSVIIDGKTGTALVLEPQQKIAVPMNGLNRSMSFMTQVDPDNPCPQIVTMAREAHHGQSGEWQCTRLGPDKVDGRSAVKFQAVSPDGNQSYGWIDTRLKVLIKAQGTRGSMELQNIHEGPQPAALFEVPADYRKMDMGQMMQEMMRQRQQQGGTGSGQ